MKRAVLLCFPFVVLTLAASASEPILPPPAPRSGAEVGAAVPQPSGSAPMATAEKNQGDALPTPPPTPSLDATKDPSDIPAWMRFLFAPDDRIQTSSYLPEISVGAGGWGTIPRGSVVKTGEWQDVFSSPFWDIDGLKTNGTRTFNFHSTGLDNETSSMAADIYGPNGRAVVDFERLIHRRDHIPLDNFGPIQYSATGFVRKQDLNVGDDYAVRIDELKTNIQGDLTDHIKLRVDVFDLHRFGERQANAVAHCFAQTGLPGRSCHVLSQRQAIDWNTTEITPRIQGTWGPVTIEYSRPMTMFSANDQGVSRAYNGSSPTLLSGIFPYAIVPDDFTQVDQLRVGWDISPFTKFYYFGFVGRTEEYYRNTNRQFDGLDFRLTNSSLEGLNLAAVGKIYYQTGSRPSAFLPEELQNTTPQAAADNIDNPEGFLRSTVGLEGRWRPGFNDDRFRFMTFTGGYQFDYLKRSNLIFEQAGGAFEFPQPNTVTNMFHLGVQQPWTPELGTYLRYKALFIHGPLYGFRADSGELNSNQPQQQHIIEFGETWTPNTKFGLFADQQLDVSWHQSDNPGLSTNHIRFDEQSYAFQTTFWYSVTKDLSLLASAAFFNNWLNQNIVLGTDYVEPGQPPGRLITPITRPWQYGGVSDLVNFRVTYLAASNVRLTGGYEYVLGQDQIFNGGFADLWPDLPNYSRVEVVTQRIFGGIDWSPRERMNLYFRYNYYAFKDHNAPYNNGTLHMFLFGSSVFF
jgi:hypothetical protein